MNPQTFVPILAQIDQKRKCTPILVTHRFISTPIYYGASKLAVVRKVLIIALLVLGIFVFMNNSAIFDRVESTGVVRPFRYAPLYLKAPEEKIQIPIRSVKTAQIANTWQAPRGEDRLHQGQDIFAPKGTAIFSATGGYVHRISETPLGGNTVSIFGAGGRVYYYAHLDAYAEGLKVGDFVSPETVIGYVGNTGNAQNTPPHLHFGVYTADGAIDPLTLF